MHIGFILCHEKLYRPLRALGRHPRLHDAYKTVATEKTALYGF